ncbi:hypothetical protein ILT44_15220 [Microvirga sp. BT689]|uniref:hypothetical protein n=1 Tax=Microvirga arvi TaxID=2778731 RepID=UPI001951431D|nr:hypothetical protein [Microvirga arvi]MBM6581545.1 hypothetical protein [Microvirga arvi]
MAAAGKTEAAERMEAAGKMEAAVKETEVERVEGEAKIKETVEATVTVLETAEGVVAKEMGTTAMVVGPPRVAGIRVTGAAEEMPRVPATQEMAMAAGAAAETTQPLAARTSELAVV